MFLFSQDHSAALAESDHHFLLKTHPLTNSTHFCECPLCARPLGHREAETGPAFSGLPWPLGHCSCSDLCDCFSLSLVCWVVFCPLLECHHFPQCVPGPFSFMFSLYSVPWWAHSDSDSSDSSVLWPRDCGSPWILRVSGRQTCCYMSPLKIPQKSQPQNVKSFFLSNLLILLDSLSWLGYHCYL